MVASVPFCCWRPATRNRGFDVRDVQIVAVEIVIEALQHFRIQVVLLVLEAAVRIGRRAVRLESGVADRNDTSVAGQSVRTVSYE